MSITAQHKALKDFYARRQQIEAQGATHELAVREPFKALLETLGRANGWTLVVEDKIEGLKRTVRPDGTLRDATTLPRGYWEAKDTRDDLDKEIEKKLAKGYPASNIIYEDTRRAVLYQGGQRVGEYDLNQPEQVATLFERFFSYTEPNIVGFEQAMSRFKDDTPRLAEGLKTLIAEAHKSNKAFQTAYAAFMETCKTALNPNISREAVDEMLIQHLLTERLMRTVFDNPDFTRRNAVAGEVEKVIDALTSRSFSRAEFLGQLGYFYEAIEGAARTLNGFRERQTFINTVYERFFQGYAVKVADTHGIVYTPQPIVDFMGAAVEEVLRDEFGLALTDEQVCIIDPATGTGNFIINLLQRIHRQDPTKLPAVYAQRLFANEVMLLPYYVASLNIEHAYYELTGSYAPFEGLCFVDTLDLAEGAQMKLAFLTEKNSQRVERQKSAPITVIIGNPPYNVGQANENDNNKNRKYAITDQRIKETYSKASKASSKAKISDAYVKFFRWATDRLNGRDGIICYVTNNSFIDDKIFDGMRKHLMDDFTKLYVLDLKGNIRQDSMRDGIPLGEKHTVFGQAAMVGISITVLVRNHRHSQSKLYYASVDFRSTREEKFEYLRKHVEIDGKHNALNTILWTELNPDSKHTWLVPANADEYATFVEMGNRESKTKGAKSSATLFKTYSLGVSTNRDDIAYDFDQVILSDRIKLFIESYNSEVDRYKRTGKGKDIDKFVQYENLKWSESLKNNLKRGQYGEYENWKIRNSLFRPFTKKFLFYDRIINERPREFARIFPTHESERENQIICSTNHSQIPFVVQISNNIASLDVGGRPGQTFPFYTYDEDGSNRRENITDWALQHFRAAYGDESISKWDIFYYVYGLLHHPAYRERYAGNLKRELPRIPLVGVDTPLGPADAKNRVPTGDDDGEGEAGKEVHSPLSSAVRRESDPTTTLAAPQAGEGPGEGFWAFSTAGQQLAALHLNYESLEPYPLQFEWKAGKPVSYRVEKMRLLKPPLPAGEGVGGEGFSVQVNDSLILRGIPPAAFDYRLGNRSALDWVIDQYQVKTDKRSGLTSDPNQYSEDEQYIVKLIGQVTRVSLETVAILAALPELRFGD